MKSLIEIDICSIGDKQLRKNVSIILRRKISFLFFDTSSLNLLMIVAVGFVVQKKHLSLEFYTINFIVFTGYFLESF